MKTVYLRYNAFVLLYLKGEAFQPRLLTLTNDPLGRNRVGVLIVLDREFRQLPWNSRGGYAMKEPLEERNKHMHQMLNKSAKQVLAGQNSSCRLHIAPLHMFTNSCDGNGSVLASKYGVVGSVSDDVMFFASCNFIISGNVYPYVRHLFEQTLRAVIWVF